MKNGTVPLRFFLDKALVAIDHVEMPHRVIFSSSRYKSNLNIGDNVAVIFCELF